jgi:predicted DCC family thiol-disulfide oxidoreductase YuxK
MAVALTTIFHVLPMLVSIDENYFPVAFKTYNLSFFTPEIVTYVQQSPIWVIQIFAGTFCVFSFFFLIGLWSQLSCILMTLACYYFYALNAFQIGTLSFDILMVTLFLMCLVPYHGDYFSLDCLLRGGEDSYRKKRPFFMQRLLQMQIGFTYFYTGLYKITGSGNWLTDNPLYYVLNYPPPGTTKYFLFRDWMMDKPELCFAVGLLIIVVELLMVFLLYFHPTRISAIYLGLIFHIVVILTLDVPAIFFFLFPFQLLLFINPEQIVDWIEDKRKRNHQSPCNILLYDGNCQFCLESLEKIKILDLFESLQYQDLHSVEQLESMHPSLNKHRAMSQLHLVEPNGKIYGGFDVFRKICFLMPMLYPMILIFYFPGMGIVGPIVYRLIAQNRTLFHFNKICTNNSCFRS